MFSQGMKQIFLLKYLNQKNRCFIIEVITLAIDKNCHNLLDIPLKNKTLLISMYHFVSFAKYPRLWINFGKAYKMMYTNSNIKINLWSNHINHQSTSKLEVDQLNRGGFITSWQYHVPINLVYNLQDLILMWHVVQWR